MDKRVEIPPNAPPRDRVEDAKARIARLDREWHEVGEAAGVSYAVRYALLRGKGSLGSLRKIEDWLAREEAKQSASKPAARADMLEEWRELGNQLQELDAQQFAAALEGLRDLVQSFKLRASGIRKMLRATPDNDR
jgi:hypothetical protein